MSEMNIKKFLDTIMARNYPNSFRWSLVAHLIQQYVTEEEIIEFYPKSIFNEQENEPVNAYVFLKDRMLSINAIAKDSTICVLKYQNLNKVSFRYFEEQIVCFEIKLLFNDGEEIVLNSNKDTNSHWSAEFRNKIERIYKFLSKEI